MIGIWIGEHKIGLLVAEIMERVLSVDEISEQYWVAAEKSKSKMNRSESEWAFQQFLQEAASSSSSDDVKLEKDPNINVNVHSQDYHNILKTKLNLACAAVALTRVCWKKLFLNFKFFGFWVWNCCGAGSVIGWRG